MAADLWREVKAQDGKLERKYDCRLSLAWEALHGGWFKLQAAEGREIEVQTKLIAYNDAVVRPGNDVVNEARQRPCQWGRACL
jgi:hypothetical protein